MKKADAVYLKFIKDVEADINKTVAENMDLVRGMKGPATAEDYRVDWIAPSIKIGTNLVDLLGDVMGHWRNYAVSAATDLPDQAKGS